MSKAVDLFLLFQIIKRIAKPFKDWQAYKLGVIDEKGNFIVPKSERDLNQKRSLSTFDILVLNIKKIIAKIPGANSKIATYTAALFLIREQEDYVSILIEEDGAPANNMGSGAIADKDRPIDKKKKHKPIKRILEEGRIDVLTTKFSDKYNDPAMVKKIIAIDPSRNNQFTEWLLRLGLKDKNVVEDTARIRGDLELFIKFKAKLPIQSRDINKFKSQSDLYDAVKVFSDVKSGKEKKSAEKDKIYKDIKILYKGPAGIIAVPKTKAASCFLGRGTRWCTAGRSGNLFSDYNSRGDLYILIHKDGTKWQFHLEPMTFMDATDRTIKPIQLKASSLFKQWQKIADPIIAKDAHNSYTYASRVVYGRFPAGEKAIAADASVSEVYANSVLKGRFPAGEKAIAKSAISSFHYASNALDERFLAGEKAILTDVSLSLVYYFRFWKLGEKWLELEETKYLQRSKILRRQYDEHANE